jgi:hypothetical protein
LLTVRMKSWTAFLELEAAISGRNGNRYTSQRA